jgi:hypothetical protein
MPTDASQIGRISLKEAKILPYFYIKGVEG